MQVYHTYFLKPLGFFILALIAATGTSARMDAVGSNIALDGDLTPSGALENNYEYPAYWNPDSESISAYFDDIHDNAFNSACKALVDTELSTEDLALFDDRAAAAINTYTVINTDPAGPGSFRQAVLDANDHGGYDKIVFAIPGDADADHTIVLENGFQQSGILVMDAVAIDGFTQGDGNYRVTIELPENYPCNTNDPANPGVCTPIPGNDYRTYLGFIGSKFEVEGVQGNADASAVRGLKFTATDGNVEGEGIENIMAGADDLLFEKNIFLEMPGSTLRSQGIFFRDPRVVNVAQQPLEGLIFRYNYSHNINLPSKIVQTYSADHSKIYYNYFFDEDTVPMTGANIIQPQGVGHKIFANRLIAKGDSIEPVGSGNPYGEIIEDSNHELFCNILEGGRNTLVLYSPRSEAPVVGDHVYNNTIKCKDYPEYPFQGHDAIEAIAGENGYMADVLIEDNFSSDCGVGAFVLNTEFTTVRSNTFVNPTSKNGLGYYGEVNVGASVENNTMEGVNIGVFDIVPLFVPLSVKDNLITTGQNDWSPFFDPNFMGVVVLDYAYEDGGANIESNTIMSPTVENPTQVPWSLVAGIVIDEGGQNVSITSNTMRSESQSEAELSYTFSEGISLGFLWLTRGTSVSDNMISGYEHGVSIFGNGNLIDSNVIEATSYGVAVGYVSDGGGDFFYGRGNQISGNTITGADNAGVLVLSAGEEHNIPFSARNSILGNSIYGNGQNGSALGVGIDLAAAGYPGDGVTPNQVGNPKDGTNDRQNYPVLNWAKEMDGMIRIHGHLNAQKNQRYRLEFFASDGPNASGYVEGQRYLGFIEVDTNGGGNYLLDSEKDFDIEILNGLSAGDYVTVTATHMVDDGAGGYTFGSTSEFSAGVLVAPPGGGN